MKLISFFIVLFFCFRADAQTTDSFVCDTADIVNAENLSAFVKGKKGKEKIIWRFFYKPFELALTDDSYKIIRFNMTWDVRHSGKDMIVTRLIKGQKVTVEIDAAEMQNPENYSLNTIAPGIMIAFDGIVAEKNGKCFRIPSFIVYTYL